MTNPWSIRYAKADGRLEFYRFFLNDYPQLYVGLPLWGEDESPDVIDKPASFTDDWYIAELVSLAVEVTIKEDGGFGDDRENVYIEWMPDNFLYSTDWYEGCGGYLLPECPRWQFDHTYYYPTIQQTVQNGFPCSSCGCGSHYFDCGPDTPDKYVYKYSAYRSVGNHMLDYLDNSYDTLGFRGGTIIVLTTDNDFEIDSVRVYGRYLAGQTPPGPGPDPQPPVGEPPALFLLGTGFLGLKLATSRLQ